MFVLLKETNNNFKTKDMTKKFAKYRLVDQKSKGYKGNYKKLFSLLNKDCIFSECYEESLEIEGNDFIVTTTWGHECENLPKGIIEIF